MRFDPNARPVSDRCRWSCRSVLKLVSIGGVAVPLIGLLVSADPVQAMRAEQLHRTSNDRNQAETHRARLNTASQSARGNVVQNIERLRRAFNDAARSENEQIERGGQLRDLYSEYTGIRTKRSRRKKIEPRYAEAHRFASSDIPQIAAQAHRGIVEAAQALFGATHQAEVTVAHEADFYVPHTGRGYRSTADGALSRDEIARRTRASTLLNENTDHDTAAGGLRQERDRYEDVLAQMEMTKERLLEVDAEAAAARENKALWHTEHDRRAIETEIETMKAQRIPIKARLDELPGRRRVLSVLIANANQTGNGSQEAIREIDDVRARIDALERQRPADERENARLAGEIDGAERVLDQVRQYDRKIQDGLRTEQGLHRRLQSLSRAAAEDHARWYSSSLDYYRYVLTGPANRTGNPEAATYASIDDNRLGVAPEFDRIGPLQPYAQPVTVEVAGHLRDGRGALRRGTGRQTLGSGDPLAEAEAFRRSQAGGAIQALPAPPARAGIPARMGRGGLPGAGRQVARGQYTAPGGAPSPWAAAFDQSNQAIGGGASSSAAAALTYDAPPSAAQRGPAAQVARGGLGNAPGRHPVAGAPAGHGQRGAPARRGGPAAQRGPRRAPAARGNRGIGALAGQVAARGGRGGIQLPPRRGGGQQGN
ncbi:MAG: hypothetical protein AAGF59_14805 [Pseudomonadota bacterium]